MTKLTRLFGLPVAILATAGLVACSQTTSTPTQTVSKTAEQTETPQTKAAQTQAFTVAQMKKAAEKVAEKTQGLVITVDANNRDRYIKVKVALDGQKVTYRVSEDGSLTQQQTEQTEKSYPTGARSYAQALADADIEDDAYLDEIELDDDNDTWVWEIDVNDAQGNDIREVKIDAHSGEIIKDKRQ